MYAEKIKQNQGAQVINMPKRKNQSYVPTEFFDTVAKMRIPGEQMQILSVIARKTWCWGKDVDGIPLSQFVEITGIKKSNVIRAIHALIDRKIIIVIKDDNKTWQHFKINSNFDIWGSLSKKRTFSKKRTTVINIDNLQVSKMIPSIDTLSKDTFSTDIKNPLPPSAEAGKPESEIQPSAKIKKLSHLSQAQAVKFKVFWESYPKHRRKEKPKAENAFKAINPDETLFAEIMAGLEASVSSHDWQKDNGQFVCYPERFLKNQKWTDEHDNGKGFKKSSCPMAGYKPSTQTPVSDVSSYIDPEEWFK